MKKLELNQMEMIEGGTSDNNCTYGAGAAILSGAAGLLSVATLGAGLLIWGAVIVATAAACSSQMGLGD